MARATHLCRSWTSLMSGAATFKTCTCLATSLNFQASCSSASRCPQTMQQDVAWAESRPQGSRMQAGVPFLGLQTRHHVRCYGSSIQSGRMTGDAGSPRKQGLNLPTILTLARVAAIPVLIAAWYWSSAWATAACTAIFVIAAITDWLDGYLARTMNASTPFGAFLDPVADKLMVAALMVLLCTQPVPAGALAGNAWLIPALTLVVIGREITMSALREWAATLGPEARAAVAVNNWGKWKTASQMTALTLLLAARDGGTDALTSAATNSGCVLLVVAAWLSVYSLALYFKELRPFMFP